MLLKLLRRYNATKHQLNNIEKQLDVHINKKVSDIITNSAVSNDIKIKALCNLIQIIPIDSEHSSMANLLSKVSTKEVKKIWLTASGGPFRDSKKFPKKCFSSLSVEDALNHPTWSMGTKISIDSATLMNKAFELIACAEQYIQ